MDTLVFVLIFVGLVAMVGLYILMFLRVRKLKEVNALLWVSNDSHRTRISELIDDNWKLGAELKKYSEWGRSLIGSGNICDECGVEISPETMKEFPGLKMCEECMLEDEQVYD